MFVPSFDFTAAITLPMSFMLAAPVSAMIACDCGTGVLVAELLGQEAFDYGDFGFLGGGEFFAIALAIHFDRFRGAA